MIVYSKTKIPAFIDILNLYQAVGWTNYSEQPNMLRRAIEQTQVKYFAYKDNQLVGILRAVGDGASILFIQDIIVDPNYQRQGIGTTLLQQCLEDNQEVYQIHLLTDDTDKTRQFYESNGFTDTLKIGCACYTRI